MKHLYTLSLALCLSLLTCANAQEFKYMRSSLSTLMIYHQEDTFASDVRTAFVAMPCPDKYDDHTLVSGGKRLVYIDDNDITGAKRKGRKGLIKADYGKNLNAKEIDANGRALEAYLNANNVAPMLIMKWFNFSEERPYFDVELIKQRGNYNATAFDVELASQTARGLVLLEDAGEQLVGNTYMLINDMTYVTAEQKAEKAKLALNILGAIFDGVAGGMTGQYSNTGRQMAEAGGQIADSYTGFKVKTHSYLFRLDWNDSIASVFYSQYWMDQNTGFDQAKFNAFVNDPMWRVRYVAHEYEYDSKSALKGKYDRREFLRTITTRSIDKNIAALQLQYEDFKVKTPVFDIVDDGAGTRLAAKIGLKEGITENSSFQVIQPIQDENGRTRYKYIATVRPVRGMIWDNRYNAAEEQAEGARLNYTTLRKVAGGSILPGMLIVEGRYRKVVE